MSSASAATGQLPKDPATKDNPLDFLLHAGGAISVTDAAYRFARREPGVDIALFRTGGIAHLRQNVPSLPKSPLPEADRAKLGAPFGHLGAVGLDGPGTPAG